MKKIFTVMALMCAVMVANAQKKYIFPVAAMMENDTTAVTMSDCVAIVEQKKVGKENGGNYTIRIEKGNQVVRVISSASRSTRFEKGVGYACLRNDNFIFCEFKNRNGGWYVDARTRNKDGKGQPLY